MVNRLDFIPKELQKGRNLGSSMTMPTGDYSISQASLVEKMVDLLELKPGYKVLEVGGGTGYHAACIAERGAEVYAVERLSHAIEVAESNLKRSGTTGVRIFEGDGFAGLPAHGPYDAISVACAVTGFPSNLFQQLAIGGILLYPAAIPGTSPGEIPDILLKIRKLGNVSQDCTAQEVRAAMEIEQICAVAFMRATSPYLPDSQIVKDFKLGNITNRIYDYGSNRPEISFIEMQFPQDSGPPLHYHLFEDEGFYILAGSFEFLIADREKTLGRSDFIMAPRNTAHRFRALAEHNRLLLSLTPAGGEQYFLEQAQVLSSSNARAEDLQAINKKYGMVLLESSEARLLKPNKR